jgi:catechol 2,3-dioxygenase-like lactoylglutathione lyase family enzyme
VASYVRNLEPGRRMGAVAGVVAATVGVVAVVLSLFARSEAPHRVPTTAPGPSLRQRAPSIADRVDAIVRDLPRANIAFNTPRTLEVHETAPIQVLLSSRKPLSVLRDELTALGRKTGVVIRASDVMVAHLDGLGFQVESVTPERQLVNRSRTTRWEWEIDPTKAGEQRLYLTLSAVVNFEGDRYPYLVQTFRRTLVVKSVRPSVIARVTGFVGDNWQFLATTLVIPLGLWAFHRRRDLSRAAVAFAPRRGRPAAGGVLSNVPRMAELEAIGITTADQAASLLFYGLLGVDVPDPGEDHVEAPVRGGLQLMWDTEELIRQIEPDLPSPVRQRIVLAFRCADPADVDAIYARVVDAGFEGKREPWDASWGQRFAYLRDPDGNTVALFAPLE